MLLMACPPLAGIVNSGSVPTEPGVIHFFV